MHSIIMLHQLCVTGRYSNTQQTMSSGIVAQVCNSFTELCDTLNVAPSMDPSIKLQCAVYFWACHHGCPQPSTWLSGVPF